VRERGGAEVELPSWRAIQNADLLSRWAFNQMLIGVATRKYARSIRLPDGDLAGQAMRATTKSSVSRRFVALSTAKLKEWLAADLSSLDLLVIQIDGLRVDEHVLVAAVGIDGAGDKYVLAVALGATENAAVVKALLADLVARGLKPDIARLFIVDGAKALSRAVRDTFGDFALIQRCQIHKGRNIIERLDPSLHASVKKVLRQAWDSPTAEQAERVLKNLARRLDHDAPGVSASILEGLVMAGHFVVTCATGKWLICKAPLITKPTMARAPISIKIVINWLWRSLIANKGPPLDGEPHRQKDR
jgi:transposase-like protein